MKLCSRLSIFFVEIFPENDKFGYLNSEPHFLEIRGDACWKAHGRLSITVNWTFFAIYYGFGAMRRKMYGLAVFTGGISLDSNFT